MRWIEGPVDGAHDGKLVGRTSINFGVTATKGSPMNSIRLANAVLVAVSAVSYASAQSLESAKPTWLPSGPFPSSSLTQVSLSNLWVAKISTDGKSIKLLNPVLKIEKSKEPVIVTKTYFKTETRTRKKEGVDAVESYEIKVPFTTKEEVYPTKFVPDGVERFSVPINETKAWKLDGIPLENERLASELANPRHVFVSVFFSEDFPGLDPYFRSVFQPNTIVIRVPHTIKTDPKYLDVSNTK